jgi:Zn-dependent peptidase ImmA (M78 family)/transcriptional regulator with XRE-family HTH domain
MSTDSFEALLRKAKSNDDDDLLKAAKSCDRLFVRSIDQLAEDSAKAKGRRLTAYEALSAYGRDVLLETLTEGSCLLADSATAAGSVLQTRRQLLGLTTRQVAERSSISQKIVEEAEASRRLPISVYERVAQALGLDERKVSFAAEPTGNERIAYRLRTLSDALPRLSPSVVSTIAEAAWVAFTQVRLEEQLEIATVKYSGEPSSNYGGPGYPAFVQGYYLGLETREKLGLGQEPIPSMRGLCEDSLGIPLIQAELGEHIAGVTLRVDKRRAIVLNIGGANRNVYQRRSTISHELGHILHDVDEKLNDLRVDEYEDLEKPLQSVSDRVEQRANAFSIEFIAPREAIIGVFRSAKTDPLGEVMHRFGVSFTAAKYHLQNGLGETLPPEMLSSRRDRPSPEFEASEAYTADFHPIRSIPILRRGKFSAIVLRAAQQKVISWSTASEYLSCDEVELRESADDIKSLFPLVFAQ